MVVVSLGLAHLRELADLGFGGGERSSVSAATCRVN